MGDTYAFRQSEGTSPVFNDLLNIVVRIGAIWGASCLSRAGFRLSGPAALCGLRFWSSLRTPFSVIGMSGMVGYLEGRWAFASSVSGKADSVVKTD